MRQRRSNFYFHGSCAKEKCGDIFNQIYINAFVLIIMYYHIECIHIYKQQVYFPRYRAASIHKCNVARKTFKKFPFFHTALLSRRLKYKSVIPFPFILLVLNLSSFMYANLSSKLNFSC